MQISITKLSPEDVNEMFHALASSEIYTWIPEKPPESIKKLKDRYTFLAGKADRHVLQCINKPISTFY